MNLMQDTLLNLKALGDKKAIIDQEGNSISFIHFHHEIVSTSAYLKTKGITRDSKVLLLMPMDIHLYSVISSLFQLGATIVLVDPWASSDYIEASLSQVNPDFVILTKKARFFFTKKAIRKIPKRIYQEELELKNTKNTLETVEDVSPEHTALITFTSGTTGVPKGFDRSHAFLLAQQKAHEKYFMHLESDIDLTMYPVFILSNLKSKMTSVLINADFKNLDSFSPEKLHKQIKEHGVTSMTLSPMILEKYINYLEVTQKSLEVKSIYTGGGPVDSFICEKVLKHTDDVNSYIVYGSTEAEPIALINFKEALEKNNEKNKAYPVGKVVDGHRYKLIELKDKVHPYHQSKPSELHLTSDFVGKKYWNNEKAFLETKYVDSENNIWHKTGDVLIQDQSETLYMLGRVNDKIITTDGILFPLIIEFQVKKLFNLKKCCYLKVKDEFILFYEGELNQNIKDHFEKEQIPLTKVVLVKKLPVDERHQTKINRKKMTSDYLKGNTMINESSSLLKRLFAYTNERFPLIPILLFVTLLTLGSANLLSVILNGNTIKFSNTALYFSIFSIFLFMLQLRLSDEIKDFDKDKIAYPERILSKGLISLKTVETILFSLIALNILLSFMMGIKYFIFMCLIQLYALLMKEEFFCKNFLEKRLGIYLISHQLILPLLCFYAGLSSFELDSSILSLPLFFTLLFLSLPSTLYELARKTWSPDKENENADSYTKAWGISRTVYTQMILLIVMIWLCKLVPIYFNLTYSLAFFITSFFVLITLLLFKEKPVKKNSKLLELSGSLYLLVIHAINTFLIF